MSSLNGQQTTSLESGNASAITKKPFNWKAPAIVLGFELLESIAFSGIALNLVVYLGTVLHGTTAFNAAHVDTWNGTTFIVPVIGAFLADSYWGKYKTILVSLVFYVVGMLLITLSASIPSLKPAPCQGTLCPPATGTQFSVLFLALYLTSIGTGGVKSALLPFGADQYDDSNPEESQKKQSFFSWFFAAINLGIFIAGTLISWIEQNVAWALGFGIGALCLTIASVGFFAGTPCYRVQLPTGSPLKNILRVFVASFKKRKLSSDDDSILYEADYKNSQKLAHTKGFRFLDKAATRDTESCCAWRLCTVTEVEEVKILLRMLPIWVTCVFYAASIGQMTTTFIQQGMAMNTKLGTFSVPVASLVSIEVVFMLVWVLLHDMVVIPLSKRHLRNPVGLTQLQRMGVGRFLVILSMAVAALVERRRLRSMRAGGGNLSIAWQIPQFVILAGSDVFSGIAQLEFFYGEAPETMRSICSAFSFLAMSLGFYVNSLVVTVVAAVTKRPGWLAVDLNTGHLDYYFWLWAVISVVNFLVYLLFASRYTLKQVVRHAHDIHEK